MRFALATFAVIAILGCSTSPTEPQKTIESTLTLHYGETATVAGTAVTFSDISDSRCPSSVTCVWAGDAAVRLQSGTGSIVLHSNTSAGPDSGQLAGLNIRLTDVKPVRVTTDEVKKSDYVITLRVSR